jgi:hypothetical protein
MGTYVSLHGRAIGYDSDTREFIYDGVTDGATAASTAANISARGITTMGSSAAKAYTLTGPIPGAYKTLTYITTSTGAHVVTLASGTFTSTSGSSFNTATFNAIGQTLSLQAISTSRYVCLGAPTAALTAV